MRVIIEGFSVVLVLLLKMRKLYSESEMRM